MWNKYRKHSIRYLSLILIGIGVASTLAFGFADRDKSVESQVHSQETEPLKFNIGLERSFIGGGLYGFPLSSSLRLGRFFLARVFAVDVTRCPSCGGRLGLVAVLSDPASIGRYLIGVGLAAEPPAIAAARPPPQRELDLVV